ncbi:hypothetical protein [Peribacillus simplex]|uniref:Uncharacterized protein n=1 Tax=Peribacillus simplex TaxID=1478 RepID=A0AAN2PF32_9BACI|nr:hypothetical protein [Peribacillus simplex]CEG31427.1 hypothetical protein BN1180_01571 [Peribacillus simplex]
MAVSMRKRPLVSGSDANRFIQKVKKNNLSVERRIEEFAKGKSEDEQREIYRQFKN